MKNRKVILTPFNTIISEEKELLGVMKDSKSLGRIGLLESQNKIMREALESMSNCFGVGSSINEVEEYFNGTARQALDKTKKINLKT